MGHKASRCVLDCAITTDNNQPASGMPGGGLTDPVAADFTHPVNSHGLLCMKLPLTLAVPVLLSAAAVLGMSSTASLARPRPAAQMYTPPPSFDSAPAVSATPSRQVSSRRIARTSRHHGRSLVRYATNEVGSPNILSDAPNGVAFGIGRSDLVSEARRYLGGNPTGKSSLWCGNFMNLVLERTGHRSSGSNTASSFAAYGTRVSGPQIGAIAVMSRRGGGHVGVVSGIDAKGNVIVVSGNHNKRVAESTYPRSRIYAYVMPK